MTLLTSKTGVSARPYRVPLCGGNKHSTLLQSSKLGQEDDDGGVEKKFPLTRLAGRKAEIKYTLERVSSVQGPENVYVDTAVARLAKIKKESGRSNCLIFLLISGLKRRRVSA